MKVIAATVTMMATVAAVAKRTAAEDNCEGTLENTSRYRR